MPQIVCCFVASLALFECRRTKKKAAIFCGSFPWPTPHFLGFFYFCYIFVTGKKRKRSCDPTRMNCNEILKLTPAAMATN